MFFKYDKETRDLIARIESNLADYERVLINKLSKRTLDQQAVRTVFLNDVHRNYILNQLCTARQTATSFTVEVSSNE